MSILFAFSRRHKVDFNPLCSEHVTNMEKNCEKRAIMNGFQGCYHAYIWGNLMLGISGNLMPGMLLQLMGFDSTFSKIQRCTNWGTEQNETDLDIDLDRNQITWN